MSNATKRTNKKQLNTSQEPNEQTKKSTETNSSFIILFVIGFIAIIFYTIWTSLATYSDQMRYDME